MYQSLIEFDRGRYEGQIIKECKDIDYLVWCYDNLFNDDRKKEALKVLLKNGFINYKNELYTEAEFERVKEREKKDKEVEVLFNNIQKSGAGRVVINFKKNIDRHGVYYGEDYLVVFKDFKEVDYNGHYYGLPTVKGVGKRIKNKEVVLLVEVVNTPYGRGLEVLKIESINGKKVKQ